MFSFRTFSIFFELVSAFVRVGKVHTELQTVKTPECFKNIEHYKYLSKIVIDLDDDSNNSKVPILNILLITNVYFTSLPAKIGPFVSYTVFLSIA